MNKRCFRRGNRRFPWSPSRCLTENGSAKKQRKQKEKPKNKKQWDRQNAEQEQKEKRQIKPRADAKADVELTAIKALEFLTFGSEWKSKDMKDKELFYKFSDEQEREGVSEKLNDMKGKELFKIKN